MESSWSERRRENAEALGRKLRQQEAAESATAAQYLQRFVRVAVNSGRQPEPLYVQGRDGRVRAKTPLVGWYLRSDKSAAVDGEGNFYLLVAPLTLKNRMFGYKPTPTAPPLVLGKGGRDGESIDLKEALTKVLPGWDKAPGAAG